MEASLSSLRSHFWDGEPEPNFDSRCVLIRANAFLRLYIFNRADGPAQPMTVAKPLGCKFTKVSSPEGIGLYTSSLSRLREGRAQRGEGNFP